MRKATWTPRFERAARRYLRRHPEEREHLHDLVRRLREDPFEPSLGTHKLRGALKGYWACSMAYDCRLLFELVRHRDTGEEVILLLTLGTHDEVY